MRGVIRKSLGAAAGVLLLVPASALAGTASLDPGGIPRLQAAANEVNSVSVGELPGTSSANKTVVFTDALPIQLGGGCFHPNPNTSRLVHCITPASNSLVRVALEDESDRLQPASVDPPTTIRFSSEGDGGNDVMIGTVNRDVLDGGSGNDVIRGRGGNDHLEGGSGRDDIDGEGDDDTLLGGAQEDDLNGGTGRDAMDGGTGNDNLNANDQAGGDTVDCGEHLFDDDLGLANLGDLVTRCERVMIVP